MNSTITKVVYIDSTMYSYMLVPNGTISVLSLSNQNIYLSYCCEYNLFDAKVHVETKVHYELIKLKQNKH